LKIGLALGGGAARGFAHVGVLEILEREGLVADMVAGTSAGGIVAACYAAGVRAERLTAAACDLARRPWLALSGPSWSNLALLDLRLSRGALVDLIGRRNIEDLPIPLFLGTCDLQTGEEVYLTQGDVIRAVLASAAVPGVFKAVRWGDRFLIDGGVVSNVPVKPLVEAGAELIIAVDLFGNVRRARKPATPIEAGLAALEFMVHQATQVQLAYYGERCPIVTISPDLADMSPLLLNLGERAMERGREAAQRALPAIKRHIRAGVT
jgi:NTE family protein